MKKKTSPHDTSDVYLETVRKRRKPTPKDVAPRTKRFRESLDPHSPRERFSRFLHQDIGSDGFSFVPAQYVGVTFFAIFLIVPKLLGMGFFFFYISGGHANLYAQVHTGDPLLDWVIGYEIFAAIVLLIIGRNLYEALTQ